jgi:hypothetical protein
VTPLHRGRRLQRIALAASLVVAAGVGFDAAAVDEYRVKAAIVYNIAKFVDWPEDVFADAATPLTICVLGRDPFGADLDDAIRGRMIKGHSAVARRIVDVATGCHVLFVAESDPKRLRSVLDRVRDTEVLTIGEAPGFLDQGGVVRLLAEDERIRFEVNLAAAERAHMRISARVLALAASVRRGSGSRP